MRRLLIIGCGDVVRRILPELVCRWRVYALVREPEAALRALGVLQIRGDLDRPATLRRLAGLAHAVLHSAPPATDGAVDAHNFDGDGQKVGPGIVRGRRGGRRDEDGGDL